METQSRILAVILFCTVLFGVFCYEAEKVEKNTIIIEPETYTAPVETEEWTETTAVAISETTEITSTTTTITSKQGTNMGNFKITVYTPSSDGGKWGYQTASGRMATHLTSCAVDPSVIPLGSTIKVGGLTLQAIDTGSAVKGNVIDIFYDGSAEDAIEWVSDFGTWHQVEVVE